MNATITLSVLPAGTVRIYCAETRTETIVTRADAALCVGALAEAWLSHLEAAGAFDDGYGWHAFPSEAEARAIQRAARKRREIILCMPHKGQWSVFCTDKDLAAYRRVAEWEAAR